MGALHLVQSTMLPLIYCIYICHDASFEIKLYDDAFSLNRVIYGWPGMPSFYLECLCVPAGVVAPT